MQNSHENKLVRQLVKPGQVILLFVICKVNSYYLKPRQSYSQRFSKRFKLASSCAHNNDISIKLYTCIINVQRYRTIDTFLFRNTLINAKFLFVSDSQFITQKCRNRIFNPFSQIDSCKESPHLEYKTNFRAVLYSC